MRKAKRGFTLAEILIVVAIIGVLTAVAIPVFTGQLEKSRQATDLANIRAAYAAAISEYMSKGELKNGYFDGSGISYAPLNGGYGKSNKSMEEFSEQSWKGIGNLVVSGTPQRNGAVNYLMANVIDDVVHLKWGVATDGAYKAAEESYGDKSLPELKEMSNAERIKADQKTLSELGAKILNNWTLSDLKEQSILQAGKGYRLANYQVNKTGSYDGTYEANGFEVTANEKFIALLREFGFDDASATVENDVGYEEKGTVTSTTADRVTYSGGTLFYSDAATNNKLKNKNGTDCEMNSSNRMLVVENVKSDKNTGRLNELTIYTKANQTAPMNDENGNDIKKYYRVTLKREADGDISVIFPN